MSLTIGSTTINDIKLGTNQINRVYVGSVQVWSNAPDYFWVEDTSGENASLIISKTSSGVSNTLTIESSTDKQTWTTVGTIDSSTYSLYPALPANGKIYLRCSATKWGQTNEGVKITRGKSHKIGGNILSLLYGSSFTGTETTAAASAFSHLFDGNTALTDASELVIPMTTIENYAMNSMFKGCSAMVSAPDLSHVTTVKNNAMLSMFLNCTALSVAPDLSSIASVTSEGLETMFSGTSITSCDLSGLVTLGSNAMNSMFKNCTSLVSCDLSSMTTVGSNALKETFQGCTSFNTVDIRSMTVWDTAKSSNWLNQTAATGTVTINQALDGVIRTNDDSAVPYGWSTVVAS